MEKIQKIKQFYLQHKFLIDCVLLSVLFFVNTFINLFTYFSFTLLFVLVVTSNLKSTLSYLFFSGAFCAITMPSSLILFMVCVVIFMLRFCYQQFFVEKHKINKKILLAILGFCVFCLLPFKNVYDFHLIYSLLFIVLVIFVFYIIIFFAKEFNIKENVRFLGYGLLISAIYALICQFVAPGLRLIGYNGAPYRFMALFFNPNGLAVTCELCIGILAYFISSNNFCKKDLFAFSIFAVMGLTSASKTFLILLCVVLLIMFIFNAKKINKKGWCGISVIALCVIVVGILKFDTILDMVGRFVRTDVSGMGLNQFLNILTTKRFELWSGYINYMLQNPWVIFFGRGLSAPIVGELKPHNVYLSAIYKLGLVGTTILILIIVLMLIDAKKKGKLNITKAIIIPLIVCAALACIEDLFFHI